MKLVTGQMRVQMHEFRDQYSHSRALTLRFVKPLLRSAHVVCGDPYFESVRTAEAPFKYGMKLIGVVKKRQKNFR